MEQRQPNFDLKEEIRAFWSARSAHFDESPAHRIEDRFGKPEWQLFLSEAMGLGRDQGAEGLRVLDIACGTGEISRMLCGLGATVTGLDFSEDMLALATAKLKGCSWTPLLGDAERLVAVEDESFDFAVTRHLAWTLTDPEAAYAEWFRVLRPGGRLLINDGNWKQPLSLAYRVKRAIADIIEPEPIFPEAAKLEHEAIFSRLAYRDGLSADDLLRALKRQGFEQVRQLDTRPLYGKGMRGHGFAHRLRQTSENRFALVVSRPLG